MGGGTGCTDPSVGHTGAPSARERFGVGKGCCSVLRVLCLGCWADQVSVPLDHLLLGTLGMALGLSEPQFKPTSWHYFRGRNNVRKRPEYSGNLTVGGTTFLFLWREKDPPLPSYCSTFSFFSVTIITLRLSIYYVCGLLSVSFL